jgi:hypothetical protein
MDTHPSALDEEHIAAILQLRRARAEAFGPELFADPAWDILLQLFAARLGNRRLHLGDFETDCPRTTLARWASVLEERGLVSCQVDGLDPQALSFEISSAGSAIMRRLFDDLRRQLASD